MVTVGATGTLAMGAFNDSIGVLNLNGGAGNAATVSGTGKLTATTYHLAGGTVDANLGAGTLDQNANTTTLNGTADAAVVGISAGTLKLGGANRLLTSAAVSMSGGTLDLNGNGTTIGALGRHDGHGQRWVRAR